MAHEKAPVSTAPVAWPGNAPALRKVSLDDKYDLTQSRVFMSGTQAVIRLTLMQKERDRRAGLNTAGYVSGYRGSPLGGLDQQFQRAAKLLMPNDVVFQPGLNEDLAATAIWGTQQAELRGEGKFDGVFALWYGKGPGVDRTGDVFRHANMAGTARHGGVLALMGDDHVAESSTVANASEFQFVDLMMPILNPAGVQEILDYGLYGIALSRFAGCWVALKCVKDNIESTSSVDGSVDRVQIVYPELPGVQPGELNIRRVDDRLEQEKRLHFQKRDAVLAFLRANKLNQYITSGGPNAKIGIITTGKSYLDTRLAMDDLGIDEKRANDLGLRLFKLACPWPIGREELLDFAKGLDLIIVVEEKRSLIEVQVREELYGSPHQPIVIGKKDEDNNWLFPAHGALDSNEIALCLADRITKHVGHLDDIVRRAEAIRASQGLYETTQPLAMRSPYFCSGCPHNTSTKVPEGARAGAGIGCHFMALWMDRSTEGFTQMGGEGANWVGEAPFSQRKHLFQNLGDGTYNHSGSLAIRFAKAAGTNITYKILYNDAVAMTGGQRHEGTLSVPQIAAQVHAEGVSRIAIVSDEPDKYAGTGVAFPFGTTFHHRDDLDAVQRELQDITGVTALIYDQTCAAEKRRRRKRGTFPDPVKRAIINPRVCEGCGDCGTASNCVSIQPLETEFGRKRMIDQSSCNKDFSCVKGFCPSFVTVHGAQMKKGKALQAGEVEVSALPAPKEPAYGQTYNMLVTGVGGTGIVTIGAILGMAAHLEDKGIGIIDMAGLAQKGGEVFSHIRIARQPEDIHTIRLAAGEVDLVLSGDLVVAGSKKVLSALRPEGGKIIVDTLESLPGQFTANPDLSLPVARLRQAIGDAAHGGGVHLIDAHTLAERLMGHAIATNMFLVGYACQSGALPLSPEAIEEAIRLNGEAVAMNRAAFRWGRLAAHDLDAVKALVAPPPAAKTHTLEDRIAFFAHELRLYQNEAYAQRYRALAEKAKAAEERLTPIPSGFGEAVAANLYKLMAIKDEYEVARLYTDGSFAKQVKEAFEGELRYEFHLSPPILAPKDPVTGLPRKVSFGPWMLHVFRLLAALKPLRGTVLDVFGRTPERKMERQVLADYERLIEELCHSLTTANHPTATALAELPRKLRGYGHVKEKALKAMKGEEALLRERLALGGPPAAKAAE